MQRKMFALLAYFIATACIPEGTINTAIPPTTPMYDCAEPGILFGPCIDNACAGDLVCFTAKSGDMCVPLFNPTVPGPADDWSVTECATKVGALACIFEVGACLIACEPSDCEAGTVCDESTDLCVWPT